MFAVLIADGTRISPASASCICRCVGGFVQAICSSSLDVEPICAPQVCPVVPPSVTPVQPPIVPPIGTNACGPSQVFNPYTGQYEWRTLCR